ncbi:unnamed protein product [Cercospora beticola]|nr:unnamed protein product [Cercospora beticola]
MLLTHTLSLLLPIISLAQAACTVQQFHGNNCDNDNSPSPLTEIPPNGFCHKALLNKHSFRLSEGCGFFDVDLWVSLVTLLPRNERNAFFLNASALPPLCKETLSSKRPQ